MSVKLPKSSALDSLSITPLIDVVFLLLIFFLVATKFEEEERELSVVLPSASEAKPMTEKPQELFINIGRDGTYIINRQPRTKTQLLADLKQASADNPGRQTVIIRADKRVVWQYVATAMDLCNAANITDYRVATDGDD
ncbi:MAG: biopolymer transporter ExbD [Planctomycetales bacterium]